MLGIGHTNCSTKFFSYLPCLQTPLTSTILYHFHWLWPSLRVTRSVHSKTYWFHFPAHFSSDQDEIWCGDIIISWTSWDFWVRFNETTSREITAVLLTVSKDFNVDMQSDVYESVWFTFGMTDCIVLYILILVWLTLALIQSDRSVRKQKTSALIISQHDQWIGMKCGVSLKLVVVMNIILTCLVQSVLKEENYAYVILSKINKTFNVGL